MDLGLHGKVVVITGATAGIGKSLIPAFLSEGCAVAVCGRNEQTNEAVRREFPDILVVRADVSRHEDMERLASETAKTFGGIDVWVNNAGILLAGALLDMPEADFDKTLEINVKGVFLGTRAATPYLKKRGGGVIINASSFATLMPSAGSGAYAASKMAVNALTQVFAAELAPQNIRVVSYIPGVITTAMNTDRIAENAPQMLDSIALRRFGAPEEVAPAVVFLASQQASYITGASVAMTGGKFCVQNPQAPWSS